MKKILAIILSIVLVVPNIVFAEDDLVEVAGGKAVTASGVTFNAPEKNLTDGNVGSYWSSNTGAVWAIVDLGKAYPLSKVEVVTRQDLDQAESRQSIRVEVSNSPDFDGEVLDLGTVTGTPFKGTANFEIEVGQAYRYIRASSGSYSVWAEIRAFYNPNIKVVEEIAYYNYQDIDDAKFREKLDLVTALHLINWEITDNMFKPDETLKRGEFASMVAKAFKLEGVPKGDYYSDTVDSKYETEINLLHNMGFWVEDGKFRPDEIVTEDDAIKVMCKALGIDAVAQIRGGKPYDYAETANSQNLLKNITRSYSSLTRQNGVLLIYNYLQSNVINVGVNGNGSMDFSTEDRTYLESVHGVKYFEEVLSANKATDIYFNGKTTDGYIKVGNKNLKVPAPLSGCESMIGQLVRVYYDDNNSIVAIHASFDQEIIVAKSDEITKTADGNFVYENEKTKKERTLKIKASTDAIYNGVASTLTADELAVTKSGRYTFIDRDGDKVFDAVSLLDFESNIVASAGSKYITLEHGNDKVLSVDENSVSNMVYKNGSIGSLSSIKPGDSISYGKSSDGKHIEIHIINSKQSGVLLSLSDEEVLLDIGKEEPDVYSKSNTLLNSYNIPLGGNVTAYFDVCGEIFYFKAMADEGSIRYAYVTKVRDWISEETGQNTAALTMFNTTGEGKYTVTEKTRIDGIKYETVDEAINAIKGALCNLDGSTNPQMIKYRSTLKLELREVYTQHGSRNLPAGTDQEKGIYQRIAPSGRVWNLNGIIDGSIPFDENTVVFKVAYYGGEYSCQIRNKSYFENGKQITFTAGYDGGDMEPLKVILVEQGMTSADNVRTYMMLDKIVEYVNADNEVQYRVTGYVKGVNTTYETVSALAIEELKTYLKRGQLIRCYLDDIGNLCGVDILYDNTNTVPTDKLHSDYVSRSKPASMAANVNESVYKDDYLIYGYIDDVKGDYVRICAGSATYLFSKALILGMVHYTDVVEPIEMSELRGRQLFPLKYHSIVAKIRNGYIDNLLVYDE